MEENKTEEVIVLTGGRGWKFRKGGKECHYYTSSWWCSDGDGASLYIEDDNMGFTLECFSGIPASTIYIDTIDFGVFYEKAGMNFTKDSLSFETQCFMIADYLCSLFCEWKECAEPTIPQA